MTNSNLTCSYRLVSVATEEQFPLTSKINLDWISGKAFVLQGWLSTGTELERL